MGNSLGGADTGEKNTTKENQHDGMDVSTFSPPPNHKTVWVVLCLLPISNMTCVMPSKGDDKDRAENKLV
jgi:hypothetical protein